MIHYAPMLMAAAGRRGGGSFLDQYSGAAAAYSLRDLTGDDPDVVNVRRSGDDATADFSATEVSDGTLATWVTAGGGDEDGFVVTWYDQSGNSKDATQATPANQPMIVDAGSLVTKSTNPALKFSSLTQSIMTASSVDISQPLSIFAVCEMEDKTDNTYIFDGVTDRVTLGTFYTGARFGLGAGGFLAYPSSSFEDQYILATGIANGTSSYVKVNGNTAQTGDAGTDGLTSLIIGDGSSAFFSGYLQELILYASDQSSNRTGIESNINSHYGIY